MTHHNLFVYFTINFSACRTVLGTYGEITVLDRRRLWTHRTDQTDACFGDRNHVEGPFGMERHWLAIPLLSSSF